MITSTVQEKEGTILKKGVKRLGRGGEVGGQWSTLGCQEAATLEGPVLTYEPGMVQTGLACLKEAV